MRLHFWSLRLALIFVTSVCILFSSSSAIAAERVVLKYRVFRQSLEVEELTNFAETGDLSSSLRVNFALARQNPQLLRQFLTTPVKVNPVLLDRVLNNPAGNLILDEISQTIHTRSRRADRQALRSALILSANRDHSLSLIEVLQNYPTADVQIEGDRLEDTYRLLLRLQGFIQEELGFIVGAITPNTSSKTHTTPNNPPWQRSLTKIFLFQQIYGKTSHYSPSTPLHSKSSKLVFPRFHVNNGVLGCRGSNFGFDS